MQLAYQKRMQVLEYVDEALKNNLDRRERQIEFGEEEKNKLNILSFGIAGAVLSFSPSSMENVLVILGMAILTLNAIFFGIIASWKQRKLNIENFESAIKDTKDIVRPFFDAYDEFIRKEPFDKKLWEKQQEAYIDFLEKQKEGSEKIKFPKRYFLNIGDAYLWIFIAGFLIVSFGLIQKYSFQGGDVSKIQIVEPMRNKRMYFR